jgi:glycosyltransferase involved in cell wall biosynthesis
VTGSSNGNRLRILVLAPDANPESISVSLVCYRHAEALAQLHTVTLVARSGNEEALRRAQGPFHAIEGIGPWLDRIFNWSFKWIFKSNFNSRALTAFSYPFALVFEWLAWRSMRERIVAGEFDIVLRLAPVISTIPSAFPFFLRNYAIPFVIGPINGGLPWPAGFSQAQNQRSWIDRLRNFSKFVPFAKSAYKRAAAILAGSSQTYAEFEGYREKLFFIPENGVSSSLCSDTVRCSRREDKLELIFVGGLIPLKACDLALRGASPLLRKDLAHFTVVGDGPERDRLGQLAKSLGIEHAVSFCGMLPHAKTLQRLRLADVLVFPSVRDFGAGVVFEALACGAVPVVADFGGPGDIVHPEVGCKVNLTNESDVVTQLERILMELSKDREFLNYLRQQGTSYARGRLTWDAKAQDTTHVLNWVLQRGPKPHLPPPKLPTTDIGNRSVMRHSPASM